MSTSIEHDLSDQGSLSRNDSEECRAVACRRAAGRRKNAAWRQAPAHQRSVSVISFVQGGPTLEKQPLLGAWLQAGWSASGKFSYQQNFPTPHSGLGAGVFQPLKAAPPGTAQPFFRLIKPPVEGRKILWVGHHHSLIFYSAKKCAVKDGDFCFLHFSLGRFSEPQTGGTSNSRKRGFFTGEGRMR